MGTHIKSKHASKSRLGRNVHGGEDGAHGDGLDGRHTDVGPAERGRRGRPGRVAHGPQAVVGVAAALQGLRHRRGVGRRGDEAGEAAQDDDRDQAGEHGCGSEGMCEHTKRR